MGTLEPYPQLRPWYCVYSLPICLTRMAQRFVPVCSVTQRARFATHCPPPSKMKLYLNKIKKPAHTSTLIRRHVGTPIDKWLRVRRTQYLFNFLCFSNAICGTQSDVLLESSAVITRVSYPWVLLRRYAHVSGSWTCEIAKTHVAPICDGHRTVSSTTPSRNAFRSGTGRKINSTLIVLFARRRS